MTARQLFKKGLRLFQFTSGDDSTRGFTLEEIESIKQAECRRIIDAMKEVERSHFRTTTDTGANPCAMLVWNSLRANLKLPRISKDDLQFWDGKKYQKPENSNLL